MIKDLLKEGIQRYLPRKYYAPIRRVQYGLPAFAAATVRGKIWRRYRCDPVPSGNDSPRLVVARGDLASGRRTDAIPRRIWIYWEQQSRPELIAALHERIVRMHPDHEVHFLDGSNASDYVPEYSSWNSRLAPQHKADLLRLYLVYRFGGIWMDSSILLGRTLDWLHEWASTNNLDFVGFRNEELESGANPIVENWFFAASKGHPFVERWIKHLAPLADKTPDEVYDLLIQSPSARVAAKTVPNPRWRLAYLANQVCFDEEIAFRMGLLRTRDEAFSVAELYSRNTWDLAMNWMVRPAPIKRPLLLKMTQRDRSVVDAFENAGLTHPESLIGEVFADYRSAEDSRV